MDILRKLPLTWHGPWGLIASLLCVASLTIGAIFGSPVLFGVGLACAFVLGLASIACGLYGAGAGAIEGWRAASRPTLRPLTALCGAVVFAGLFFGYGLEGDYAGVANYDFGDLPAVVGSVFPGAAATPSAPTIAKQPDSTRPQETALRDQPLKATSGSGEPVEAAPPRAPSPTPGILSKLDDASDEIRPVLMKSIDPIPSQ
jgi:hypothetical protein